MSKVHKDRVQEVHQGSEQMTNCIFKHISFRTLKWARKNIATFCWPCVFLLKVIPVTGHGQQQSAKSFKGIVCSPQCYPVIIYLSLCCSKCPSVEEKCRYLAECSPCSFHTMKVNRMQQQMTFSIIHVKWMMPNGVKQEDFQEITTSISALPHTNLPCDLKYIIIVG